MHLKPGRRRQLVAVAVGFVLLVGVATWFIYPYFSFSVIFRRSTPALDRYAAQVTATGSTALATPPGRLGYFKVLKVESLPHGFLFQHDAGNPFDWNGLAYSTEPLPREEKNREGKVRRMFIPIEGNWYDAFRARP